MNIITALISPISGAIIGYFTNWLAIKMLFRPHNEKRIFNIKVPFTPGLIPKERYNLSAKVGDTIGKHLITAEVLTKEITSDEVSEKIKSILDGFFDELIEKNLSIEDVLQMMAGDESKQAIEKCTELIRETAVGYSRNESVSAFISNTLIDKLAELLKDEEVFKKAVGFLESIRDTAVEKGSDFFAGEEFKAIIIGSIDGLYKYSDKRLDEIIPENAVTALKNAVRDYLPKSVEMIKNITVEYPAIDESLSKTVGKIIDDNFGKLIGIFINHEKIYGNIKEGIFGYLDDEANRDFICTKIEETVSKFLANDLGTLIGKIPDKESLINKGVEMLTQALSDNLVNSLFDFLVSKLSGIEGCSIYSMIEKVRPGFEDSARDAVFNRISAYLDEHADAIISPVIQKAKKWILNVSIDSLIMQIGNGSVDNTKAMALSLIRTALEKCSGYVVESLNVPKMVEDKMNAFDVAEAESIIISVVSKELKAITALGGVLGFIIGLLPLLFNNPM